MNIFKQISEKIFLKRFDKMIKLSIQIASAHGYDLTIGSDNINTNISRFIEFIKYRSNQEKDITTDISELTVSIIEPLSYYFCLLNIVNNNNVYEISIDKKTKKIVLFDIKYNSGLIINSYQLLHDVLFNKVKFERIEYIFDLLHKIAAESITTDDIKSELKTINEKTLLNN